MRIMIVLLLATLLLAGCLHEPIHQGNRLDINKVNLISEGDTQFNIEQRLGSPSIRSTLHPHRVIYYEMFEDEESGEMRKRGVEVSYDDAWRAKAIRRFGFDNDNDRSASE